MKVAILGSGVSGSLVYRLLREKGINVSLFGKKWETACTIRPCAWGVRRSVFLDLCDSTGLTGNEYILERHNSFRINGVKMPCDMITIDKPKLLRELNGGNYSYSATDLNQYDQVIDATGIGRNGATRYCYQQMIVDKCDLSAQVRLLPHMTCSWAFPMGESYHLGVFSNRIIPDRRPDSNTICECRSSFVVGMPKKLVVGNTWLVGESAGIIDPITGSGILPAMISARILVNNWGDPPGYEQEIFSKFGYMRHKIGAIFHNEFRGIPISISGLLAGALLSTRKNNRLGA